MGDRSRDSELPWDDGSADLREELARHAVFVRRIAGPLVRGDVAGADDVAQEAVACVLARPPRRIDALRAFLATTVRRLVVRRGRDERRRSAREAVVARAEGVDGGDDARVQILEQVTAGVATLGEPYRRTVLARYYEGLAPRQIASREGVSVGAVHTRLRRAHEMLRARLDREVEGGRGVWTLGLLAWSSPPAAGVPVAVSPDAVGGAPVGAAPTTAVSSGALVAAGGVLGVSKVWSSSAVVGGIVLLACAVGWSQGWFGKPRQVPLGEKAGVGDRLQGELARRGEATEGERSDGPSAERVEVDSPTLVAETDPPTLQVQVLWRDDRAPVPDVGIDLLFWEAEDPFRERVQLRTDSEGFLRVDDPPATGRVLLNAALGGGGSVELAEQGLTEEVLLLPRGRTLDGRVLDSADVPVADASIWVSDYGNDYHGEVVARTGPRGRFHLVGVGEGRSIAAFAHDCLPGPMQRIDELAVDEEAILRLQRDRSVAALAVEVVDVAGQPVVGAELRIDAAVAGLELGSLREERPGRVVQLDDTGRALVEGLAPGATKVAIRAPGGLALTSMRLELLPGEHRDLRVVMQPGVSLRGRVLAATGEAVERAEVQVGEYSAFDAWFTRSRVDGSFTLTGLPVDRAFGVRVERDGVGRAERSFEAAAGTALEWNVVLDPGAVFRARVVGDDDVPRVGWSVYAISDALEGDNGTLWSRSVKTDENGRLLLTAVPDANLRLELRAPGAVYPTKVFSRMRPAAEELTLHVGEDELPQSALVGRLVDHAGRPVANAQLSVTLLGVGGLRIPRPATTEDDGRFRVVGLVAGEAVLHVDSPGVPRQRLWRGELEMRREAETGVLELAEPGYILVRTEGGDGLRAPFDRLVLQPVVKEGVFGAPSSIERGHNEAVAVLPGSYAWTAEGDGVVRIAGRVDVPLPGDRVVVDLVPERGEPCDFVLLYDPPSTTDSASSVFLTATVWAADESVAATWSSVVRPAVRPEEPTRRVLRPGSYRLVVRRFARGVDGEQQEVEVSFDVAAGGTSRPVEVTVR